ncbi:MAG TPA: DNA alkylation repair protein, partial [Kofleriaceae bacterium]
LRDSKSWAYVDALATHVMGPLVTADAKLNRTLDRWAKDDNFWIRRSALLALLVPLREGGGDFARFGRYADPMLDEREFFIRKAIGWILRETSRKQQRLVFAWLVPRAKRLSGVTMREAVKYLTPAQRARLAR